MKLTVLTWLRDSSITFVGRLIELVFRAVLLILPLGLYLYLIQARNKASKISSISVYTTDDSTWQHVFPGFLLVAIDPKVLHKKRVAFKEKLQNWVQANKYLLSFIFMLLIVLLMVIGEITK